MKSQQVFDMVRFLRSWLELRGGCKLDDKSDDWVLSQARGLILDPLYYEDMSRIRRERELEKGEIAMATED